MHKLHEMLEKIEETMAEQLNKGIDNVDTKEFGDVADITVGSLEARHLADL